ncbi:hypothetical protein K458DRAFT_386555 [Lentithecium fluviatile CBS 122367]|uniref:Uncharacterized protein n=1 Tax=Lentithecium fluviatile CBS 122367 TaxID=1168545 RepID=A0A6G1J7T6_9PLEO|nr:hypothetical protein K458DRAFT_386555 [Lentithecium fluviatile CBS 122367]
MSNSATSTALATSNGSGSTFTQQGSLDWAGIDTLTVAFGQAMFLRLPIGPYGEKVLAEYMGRLTAKPCAANLIWFGVGVRHILRELVQTSQGCSLVALCAALTEAHSISVSALVIYEIAKESGGPQALAPSLEQWEALIRVAASVFNGTTFGLRISQIAKFGTPHQGKSIKTLQVLTLPILPNFYYRLVRSSMEPYRAFRSKEAVAVVGSPHGRTSFLASGCLHEMPMVTSFTPTTMPKRPSQKSRSVFWQIKILDECFAQRMNWSMGSDLLFSPGRLEWETMFSDMFGTQFKVLMKRKNGTTSPLRPFMRREGAEDRTPLLLRQYMRRKETEDRSPSEDEFLSEDQIFSRLLAIAIIIIVKKGLPDVQNGSASRYLLRASENIPELRQCSEQTLFAITDFMTLYSPEERILGCPAESDSPVPQSLVLGFYDYLDRLCGRCSCQDHQKSLTETGKVSRFCLTQLAIMIFQMISLFDRVVVDTPLRPSVYGLHHLYDTSGFTRKDCIQMLSSTE